MLNNKAKIRALILIVILFFVSFLLLRFIFEFAQASQSSILITIILIPTEAISIFFRSIKIGGIEISSIFAIIFLIITGYLVSKVLTATEREDKDSVMMEYIEAFLRAVEFLLVLRAILNLIGADAISSGFVAIVYFLTGWAEVILQPINLSFGYLDLSALIMLVVVILLDINTEVILRGVKFLKAGSAKSVDFISNATAKRELSSSNNNSSLEDALKPTLLPPQDNQQENPNQSQGKPDQSNNNANEANNTSVNKNPGGQTIVINIAPEDQQPRVINISGDQVEIAPVSESSESSPSKQINEDTNKVQDSSNDYLSTHTKHKDDKRAPEG